MEGCAATEIFTVSVGFGTIFKIFFSLKHFFGVVSTVHIIASTYLSNIFRFLVLFSVGLFSY